MIGRPVSPPSDQQPTGTRPPGVDVPVIEVFGLLLEAHARLVSRLDQELVDGEKVSLQSFEVLIRLARTPGESLTAGELARAVALSSGGGTRLVDRLEAAGLVVRGADTADRRVVRVGLTAAGRKALFDALPIHLAGLEEHLAGPLSSLELEALGRTARSIRDGLDAALTDD